MNGIRLELGIYRHWKGHHYLALFTARDSNNDANHEDVVVYLSLDAPRAGCINVRGKSEFLETVTLPDGGHAQRFTYIGPSPAPAPKA